MIDLTFELAGPGGTEGQITLHLDPERSNSETLAVAEFFRERLYMQDTFEITANGKTISGFLVVGLDRVEEHAQPCPSPFPAV